MSQQRTILLCLLLGAITLGLYWRATSCDFIVMNDDLYVTDNPYIQHGLNPKSVEWAFASDYAGNWHPLTWISHMLDWQIYGAKPGGHHLTNVLFHCCNAILLFLVLLRMSGAMWPSWLVAALFAWHPMHVESVAWVAERKDVLSTFFALLTILAYAFYVREPKTNKSSKIICYCAALACFALSLMAKQMYVTLPCVLLLLDYWPLTRFTLETKGKLKGLALEKVPFLVLVVIASVLTCSAQSKLFVVKLDLIPMSERISHGCVAYLEYVEKMLWPSHMAIFYPYGDPPTFSHILIATFMLLAISCVAISWLRAAPYLSVGWFWFLGTLVPVIGIVQVGRQGMADRYTYFPYVGLFISIAWGATKLWEQKTWRPAIVGGAIAALAGCFAVTTVQLQYWRDTQTLFDHALKVTTGNYAAYGARAQQLQKEGKFDEAYTYASNALACNPDFIAAYFVQGMVYKNKNDWDKAEASFANAVRLNPNVAEPHCQLGLVYLHNGRFEDASNELASAIALERSNPDTLCGLASLCLQRKDYSGAIEHLQAALQVKPNFIEALNNLAWLRAANEKAEFRDGQEAVVLARRACDATHYDLPVLLGTLAAAYAEAGQFTNAVATATKAHDIALAKNQKAVADRNAELIELYKSGRAFHEGEGSVAAKN